VDIELREEFRLLHQKLDRLIVLEPRVEHLETLLHDHTTQDAIACHGHGGEDNPGLIKQVDRLVQSERRRMWLSAAGLTAFIGLVMEKVWHLL